jgi:hypothetical protein
MSGGVGGVTGAIPSPRPDRIRQHTNPAGIIQDTVRQKLIMVSLRDGALWRLADQKKRRRHRFLTDQ